MTDAWALAGILGALAVGVISPGPSFVIVARTAVTSSRANAVALSAARPRDAYLRAKTGIDLVAGGVMISLGVKLATSSR